MQADLQAAGDFRQGVFPEHDIRRHRVVAEGDEGAALAGGPGPGAIVRQQRVAQRVSRGGLVFRVAVVLLVVSAGAHIADHPDGGQVDVGKASTQLVIEHFVEQRGEARQLEQLLAQGLQVMFLMQID